MKVLVKGRTSSNEGHHHEYIVYEDGSVEILPAYHPENPKIFHGHEYNGEFPLGEVTKRGISMNQSSCYPNCAEMHGHSGAGLHNHIIGLRVPNDFEKQQVFFRGSNEMGAKDVFVNRKKYRQEAFPLEAVQPLDTWYENSYYGKVNEAGDAVYLFSRNDAFLDVIGKNVIALDFVADAFANLTREYSGFVDNGNLDPIKGMKYLKAKSSWIDPEIEYIKHLQDVKDFLLSDLLAQKYATITSFGDFIKEIYGFLRNMGKKYPLSRSGFILSSRPRANFTGLAVDLELGDYAEDPSKDEILKDQCKLVWFTHLAARHGFFLDKNAPWRFIYNIGLDARTLMTPADYAGPLATKGPPRDVFSRYYAKAYRDDLTDLASFAVQTYNELNERFPTYKITCRQSRRQLTRIRPAIQRRDYDDQFWYEFLFRVRLLETDLVRNFSEHEIRSFITEVSSLASINGLEATLKKINDKVKSLNLDLQIKTNFSVDGRQVPMVKSFLDDDDRGMY
jgi:hypothetical protein